MEFGHLACVMAIILVAIALVHFLDQKSGRKPAKVSSALAFAVAFPFLLIGIGSGIAIIWITNKLEEI